jgi:hypothetical protein
MGEWLTIRACVRDLSQRLARKFGLRDTYSVTEVDSVLEDWNMRLRFPEYAYALFCSHGDFERLDPRVREGLDYETCRRKVKGQYPRLENLNGRDIAIFARSHWWRQTLSWVDLPDSFQPDRPERISPPVYVEPTLGIRGVLLTLLGAAAGIALAAFFVARLLLR